MSQGEFSHLLNDGAAPAAAIQPAPAIIDFVIEIMEDAPNLHADNRARGPPSEGSTTSFVRVQRWVNESPFDRTSEIGSFTTDATDAPAAANPIPESASLAEDSAVAEEVPIMHGAGTHR